MERQRPSINIGETINPTVQATLISDPYAGMSQKEINNLEWLEQKAQNEQWNQAHRWGWHKGVYYENGVAR